LPSLGLSCFCLGLGLRPSHCHSCHSPAG
jgi:hypothetical protein